MYIVVIRTFNAENYIKLAINSVKNQTVDNWKCVIVNDLSTDKTKEIIENEIKDDLRFNLITNEIHSGSALESFINGVNYIKPDNEDILVVLDGDDYLENNCLEVLKKYYTNPMILLTYGSFQFTHSKARGSETRAGYTLDEDIRKTPWKASHCRTFKYKLFKAVPNESFLGTDGKYFGPSEDLAMMFPLIETAGLDHTQYVNEIIYNYNEQNPISDFRVKTVSQNDNAKYIRSLPQLKQHIFDENVLNIALLTIATNKYIKFIEPLYNSMKQYFLTEHNVDMFCFTDKEVPMGVIKIDQEHKPFPYPTLMRYHIFLKNIDKFKNYDAVYYCDADMLFVDKIGNEILSNITAVKHPGFHFKSPNEFSYQRHVISSAAIPMGQGSFYFCGGFNGGFKYLDMCKELVKLIDLDLNKNICAVWHDESYLNKYLFDNPPSCILSPAYCIPDPKNEKRLVELKLQEFKPKLIALDKNHNEIRS